ncbi:MAG: hypothetical protein J7L20_02795 [Thermoplasmata archaeon]|nr:hypothetical protein [Thermoplasmata archaeon]
MEKILRCPRCGSEDFVIVARLPWSTDGLTPKQIIFLECKKCHFSIPIHRVSELLK